MAVTDPKPQAYVSEQKLESTQPSSFGENKTSARRTSQPKASPHAAELKKAKKKSPSAVAETLKNAVKETPIVIGPSSRVWTAREDDLTEPQEEEENKKWYQSIDYAPLLDVCIWGSVLDPSQAQHLHEYSELFGGMYFLLTYFVLTYSVQLPLSFVLLHWGQFSQAGLTKITCLFGRGFRGLGYAMIVWQVIQQGILVKEAGVQLGHTMMMQPKLDYFLQCYPRDLDCHLNCDLQDCCASMAEKMICAQSKNHDLCPRQTHGGDFKRKYLGQGSSVCRNRTRVPALRSKPASLLYLKSRQLSVDLPLGDYASVTATLIVVGCVVAASLGNPLFYIIYACLALVTMQLVLVHCGIMLFSGSLLTGINKLVHLSQLQRFCSVEVVYALYNSLISPVNLKFFVLSMASFRKKRADAYSTAIQITLTHLALSALFLTANLAMTARLDADGDKLNMMASSMPSVADVILKKRDTFWQSVVPEFYGTYKMAPSFIIFALMLFCLHLMPILGPFFTLCDLKRHHEVKQPRLVVNIIFACLMGAAVLYVAGVTLAYPNIAGRWHGFSGHVFGGILLLLFHLITVRFYGSGEFAVDLCYLYPVTNTIHRCYGPQSKVFRFLLRVAVPLALLASLAIQLRFNFTFDHAEWDQFGSFMEMVLPLLPIYVLEAFVSMEVGAAIIDCWEQFDKRYNIFQLVSSRFQPSLPHPSYILQEKQNGKRHPD